mgnify:CR=1 FL=1
MRRSIILPMLVIAMTVTSCDFMRKMVGRPTSDELEMLKEEIGRIEQLRQEEARVRASLDSLEAVRQGLQETVEETVEVAVEVAPVQKAPDHSQYLTPNLENKYYVVIGAFQSYENARALMKKAARYGYSPVLLSCRHGLIGVGVCPVDEYEDALKALQILRREKFCPSDIWIYTNKR